MPSTAPSHRSFRSQLLLASGAVGLAAIIASTVVGQNALDPKPRDSGSRQGAQGGGRPGGAPRPGGAGQQQPTSRGGGTALDHNLQRGSGGVNQKSAPIDFAARNAIVTGSVAGGRGFRGSVGYRAAEDFRGTTAGDSSFGFRSNSAISAPYLFSISTADRFSLAQDLGIYEFRRDATPMPMTSGKTTSSRVRLDRSAAAISSGRMFEYEAEPTKFATGGSEKQQVDYLVSITQGFRTRRPDDAVENSGLPTFERARARQDLANGRVDASKPISSFQSPLLDSSIGDDAKRDTRIEPTIPGVTKEAPKDKPTSSYDQIVKRIVERYGDDKSVHIDANPNAIERAKSELTKLRDAMNGRTPRDDKRGPTDPSIDPVTGLPKKPKPSEGPDGKPNENGGMRDTDADEAKKRAEDMQKTVTAAGEALRHGTTVRDLTPGERSRVDELVRNGQQLIASGDYFRAERCFDQALELNPDNPLLFAGLAHCQLGAGLHLSAALTLRTLFSNHPEMIDTRYERSLLPNETRMRLAIETLRKRITAGQDADGYGLTLAYLGHQLDEKALVTEGLAAVKGTIENDLLNQLLNQIWLGEKKSGEQPGAAPASEPAPQPSAPQTSPPPAARPADEPSK